MYNFLDELKNDPHWKNHYPMPSFAGILSWGNTAGVQVEGKRKCIERITYRHSLPGSENTWGLAYIGKTGDIKTLEGMLESFMQTNIESVGSKPSHYFRWDLLTCSFLLYFDADRYEVNKNYPWHDGVLRIPFGCSCQALANLKMMVYTPLRHGQYWHVGREPFCLLNEAHHEIYRCCMAALVCLGCSLSHLLSIAAMAGNLEAVEYLFSLMNQEDTHQSYNMEMHYLWVAVSMADNYGYLAIRDFLLFDKKLPLDECCYNLLRSSPQLLELVERRDAFLLLNNKLAEKANSKHVSKI